MTERQIHAPDYQGPDRRSMPLSEEQIEAIAERAAQKAVQTMTDQAYGAVGRITVKGALSLIGVIALGLLALLSAKGYIR